MSKDSVKITVEGTSGTGKSTMMYLIQRMLQLHGFHVDVMDDEMRMGLTQVQWNSKMQKGLLDGSIHGIQSKYYEFDYGPIQINEKYSEVN
jgi:nucleoside-triphosphatase THEP1